MSAESDSRELRTSGQRGLFRLPVSPTVLPGWSPRSLRDDPFLTPTFPSIALQQLDASLVERISNTYRLGRVTSSFLASRGHKVGEELEAFLSPQLGHLPIPHIGRHPMLGFSQLMEVYLKHIQQGHSIAHLCDFDVDGTTAGSLGKILCDLIGVPSTVVVGDRMEETEGYGPQRPLFDAAHEFGAKLAILYDYGAGHPEQIRYGREVHGLDVLGLDHHFAPTVESPANVLIDPAQSSCRFADNVLSAAGLSAYVFLRACTLLNLPAEYKERAFALAALGLVADMVPLQGPSRVLAEHGLRAINRAFEERSPVAPFVGIRALMRAARLSKLDAGSIAFEIAPRINAAGRLAHAQSVVRLLTTNDNEEAGSLASELDVLNRKRRELQHLQLLQLLQQTTQRHGNLPPAIVEHNEEFHPGIVGLLAQGASERWRVPSFVMTTLHGKQKGSGRSPLPEIHCGELMKLAKERGLIVDGGGHQAACGFSVALGQGAAFASFLLQEVSNRRRHQLPQARFRADCSTTFAALMHEQEQILRLGPFGQGNEPPRILIPGARVERMEVFHDRHLRTVLRDTSGAQFETILWRSTYHPELEKRRRVDVGVSVTPGYRGAGLSFTLEAVQHAG